jgi:hypothetical protein
VAGQTCNVSWNDNGKNNITLAQHGNCTVALYTGNAQQQVGFCFSPFFFGPVQFASGDSVIHKPLNPRLDHIHTGSHQLTKRFLFPKTTRKES